MLQDYRKKIPYTATARTSEAADGGLAASTDDRIGSHHNTEEIELQNTERGNESGRESEELSQTPRDEGRVRDLTLPGEDFEEVWTSWIYLRVTLMFALALNLGWALASVYEPVLCLSLLAIATTLELRGVIVSHQVRKYAKRHGIEDI